MLMTGPLFGTALLVVPACWLGIIASVTTVTAVPPMTAMPAVAKHMHCYHPNGEQYPNPVL